MRAWRQSNYQRHLTFQRAREQHLAADASDDSDERSKTALPDREILCSTIVAA